MTELRIDKVDLLQNEAFGSSTWGAYTIGDNYRTGIVMFQGPVHPV